MSNQLSRISDQHKEKGSAATPLETRMGMPIDWAIKAIRSWEARPVLKEEKRVKAAAEVRRRALMTLISRVAAGVAAHDRIR